VHLGSAQTAKAVADLPSRAAVSEERDGQPQRAGAKVPSRGDTQGDDGDHRATCPAMVAPSSNGDARSGAVGIETAAQLTITQAVPNHLQAAAHRAATDAASWAAGWAYALDRRHLPQPKLDDDVRMNDMTNAQGLSQVAPEHGEALRTPRHLFCGRDPLDAPPPERRRYII
jgi:hypothetical protein